MFEISKELIQEYHQLFQQYKIPIAAKKEGPEIAENIVMISTHGYWGDPPPAGVPDTGGQTYYVLEVSKAWAERGRKVIIVARWFEPYPRVEKFADNLWLIRIRAGGDEFIRKEDIYPLVPEMAEASTAISTIFGANIVMGHYADGMAQAIEVGERLRIPAIVIPHSMGIRKLTNLGYDPMDPASWLNPKFNFWTREALELTSLRGSNLEVANTPAEPKVLKGYYNAVFPHIVMPAGAGEDYFNTYLNNPNPDLLKKFGLAPKKYLIFFGRIAVGKNIPAVIDLLSETRKLDHKKFGDIKLAIVGGEPESPQGGEVAVEKKIKDKISELGLTNSDVLRITSQAWKELSILAHYALFYVGMQTMEPFGMGAAEAMAAGAPILISKNAGITRWLKNGKHALVVDPEDPKTAAKELAKVLNNKELYDNMSISAHDIAEQKFSWIGIAKNFEYLMDRFYTETSKKRTGRAYHRLTFVWRGDPPIIKDKHKRAALGLIPYIKAAVKEARLSGKRLSVGLGGESGAGKTEVAEYLRFLLRGEGLRGATIPGDAFFKLVPKENYAARLKEYSKENLENYVGPEEVDLERLDSTIKIALQKETKTVYAPSESRKLDSRRYDAVPLDLSNIDVVFIDLTYSLLLKNADIKVFFESDYKKRIDEIKERNLARDPDQDFEFILKVLEIEHGIIQKLKKEADLIVNMSYTVTKS